MIHDETDIDIVGEYVPHPVVSGFHHAQMACFYDPSRYKCALASRQSGKSHLDAGWLLGGEPGQESLYCARTIGGAWDIMYSVFHELNTFYNLGLRILKGDSQIVEPNGHIIHVDGIKDNNAAEGHRGKRFRRIVVDEAGAFHSELLKYAIEGVLQPTLLKYGGDMLVNGTPGLEPEGYFYELAGDPFSGVQGKWPCHHWTIYDNPHIPDLGAFLSDILALNAWTTDNPTFQREYLARWVPDRGSKVYDWIGTFTPGGAEGLTILGLDFGYDPDKTAFVVLRMTSQPHVHCLKAFSVNHLTPHTIADIVNQLRQEYHPNHIIADEGALGKGYAAELRDQFKIPVEPAEKRDKKARIELLRGIIACSQFHMAEEAAELADEWKVLPWGPQRKDHHDKYKQDCSDATLYALSKMLQTNPYQAPVDNRTPIAIEQERMRLRAMQKASGRFNKTRLMQDIERQIALGRFGGFKPRLVQDIERQVATGRFTPMLRAA